MFNFFDIIALAFILLGGYFGLQTGILASTFYVASGFVGLWSAHHYAARLGMNFYLLFALAAAVVILLGFLLSRLFKKMFLGKPDRLIGGLLGLCLGVLIVSMALVPAFFHLTPKARDLAASSCTGSRFLPCLEKVLPGIRRFSVKEVKNVLPVVKIKLPSTAKDGK
jgi:uncharacterized membrane protein required for colicin V production